MNVKLLKRIANIIQRRADQFNMSYWFHESAFSSHCKTESCIAGWALTLTDTKKKTLAQPLLTARDIKPDFGGCNFIDGYENKDVVLRARKVLDLNEEQSRRLFYVEKWPFNFELAYRHATRHSKENARIAANRIRHFIKTNGEE